MFVFSIMLDDSSISIFFSFFRVLIIRCLVDSKIYTVYSHPQQMDNWQFFPVEMDPILGYSVSQAVIKIRQKQRNTCPGCYYSVVLKIPYIEEIAIICLFVYRLVFIFPSESFIILTSKKLAIIVFIF
jgi:hypothetical protein